MVHDKAVCRAEKGNAGKIQASEVSGFRVSGQGYYLEGHGDSVSSLITFISHMITPIIPICNLLHKSP